jgi:monoamine oxidase
LTVPLTVLQRNLITFDPPLSEKKINAIHSFGMDAGMKLIIKFSEKFFPDDMGYLLGTDSVHEFWFPAVGRYDEDNTYVTCFATGKKAERYTGTGLDAENPLNVLDETIGELQRIFKQENLYAKYENHLFQDWTNEPFIYGAYSFPLPEAGGKRKFLAETHAERVFFAGEACATNGHAASIHGAIETAENAVAEIKADILRRQNKKRNR